MPLEFAEVVRELKLADNQFLCMRISCDGMSDAVSIQVTILITIHIYDVFVVVVGEHPGKGAFQNAVPKSLMVLMAEVVQVQGGPLLVIWWV